MKLTKASREILEAIRDAIASGKAVGGLLAGFAAAALTGCSERPPTHTMGKYVVSEQTDETGEKCDETPEAADAPERAETAETAEATES